MKNVFTNITKDVYEKMGHVIHEVPTAIFGLTKEYHMAGDGDYSDWLDCDAKELHATLGYPFSEKDKAVIKKILDELKITGLKNIAEIGISHTFSNSSTMFMLKEKTDDVRYVGVDITPECIIATMAWQFQRTYPLLENSQNYTKILSYMDHVGMKEIDFLHIDGNHSTSHVYNDFKFASMVRKGGYVMFHDTNYHPGPALLLECIDTSLFEITRYYEREDDWGVATLKRL